MFGNNADDQITDVNDDAGAAAYEAAQGKDDNDNGDDDNNDGDDGDDSDPSKADAGSDDDELDFTYNGEILASQATDDEDQDGDTDLVKHLRKQLREQRNELKAKGTSSQQQAAPQNLPEEIPPQPQLGDDGIDWDNEKHAAKMNEWLETRDAINLRNQKREQANQQLQTRFQERQQFYKSERAKVLKVPGYERAEKVVEAEIPQNLQLTLLMNSKNPAGAVLALGRNPALRKQLQDVSGDPVALGYLLAEIDKGAGFKPRSKSTAKGAPAVKTGATQTTIHGLEAAIEKARESGDYTTVLQLKDKLKAAKKAG